MGTSVSKAASDVGSVVGSAIAAPLKAIFGHSCQDVCSGIWDVGCFIEHLCVPDLVKLMLVCGLCYICLIFLYTLYKLGLCQCVVKSLCKMCWAACEAYWLTLDYICCYCWHKIRYTKRVYRGRHRRLQRRLRRDDIELGHSTSTSSSSEKGYSESSRIENGSSVLRKRKSRRGGDTTRKMNRPKTVRLKSGKMSVHLKGKSKRERRRRRSNRVKELQLRRSGLGKSRRTSKANFKRAKLGDPSETTDLHLQHEKE